MAYVNQNGQIRVGVRGWVPVFGSEDPGTPNTIDQDSTNFILASGISDSVQTSAIETLVSDLKTYGLWTKMKAIYPFVGGSAASHKFNLKDPRDLDAAYRLAFNGGWTHTSNGAKPNGTTGYANPFYTNVTDNSSIWYYSRTNNIIAAAEMAVYNNPYSDTGIYCNYNGTSGGYIRALSNGYTGLSWPATTSQGFFGANRTSSTLANSWYNGVKKGTNTNASSQDAFTKSLFIAAYHSNAGAQQFSNRESAFASIGDGLTDTEEANFNTAVQKFQTTLGRHVGTPYVSDPDAIAFLMAAGITDGTQAAAINTLVIRMKADGVWTKMKAIYPFVGGNATSHKFNLKDPRDLDEAFRLVFNGGWIHSSTGALPNGTTAYAETKLVPNTVLIARNTHMSLYSRENTIAENYRLDMGACNFNTAIPIMSLSPKYDSSSRALSDSYNLNTNRILVSNGDSKGFYLSTRTSINSHKVFKDTTILATDTVNDGTNSTPQFQITIGGFNFGGSIVQYSNRELAVASIGDGLTDAEATAFYTAVQAYQTTLGRQVNIPVVSDGDAQAFLNAANITSFQQATAVNKLVVDLKAAGVWSKMKAIYPFVGGSATSHKWNLKDPRDLDAAYRLVFNGGWTHTGTGALPNGTTGYARTFLIPKTTFGRNISNTGDNAIIHVSKYSRTNQTITSNFWLEGVYSLKTGGGTSGFNPADLVFLNHSFSTQYQGSSSTTIGGVDPNASIYGFSNNTQGYFLFTRTSNNMFRAFRNNNLVGTNTYDVTTSVETPQTEYLLGVRNDSYNNQFNPFGYNPLENSFTSIGDGLTDAESTALYTAVQTYQTSLGRAVDTPVYNNGLVLNLDAGNANSYPGTGTTWFDLASGNNGTLTNGPTYDATNGGSIVFDGVNDYVGLGNTPIFGTSSFTIDMWIYLPISDYNYRAILSKRSNSNYTGFAVYRPPYTNSIAIQLASINGGPYFTTSIYLTSSSWNHVSIIVDRTSKTVILYSNGIRNTSTLDITNLGDMTNNGVNLNLGLEAGISNWNNKISTTKIYSRALSETEVINNFNSTRGRFGL